jgi:UDP-N-acetylglucosamine acyltransferase
MKIGKNCQIHKTAIIEKGAIIGNNVEIGAYSIIGKQVKIGDENIIKPHICIDGNTVIGNNNIIFSFAVIGEIPQDLKYKGEKSQLIIGNNNRIREHSTIHLGTESGNMVTIIGDNCLLMIGSHVAHDCVIGSNVILANNATLAGHVEVGDYAIIGGLSAIHQFVRIGKHAMIGGMSGVENDVIPYGMVMGERAFLAGLNLVGLKRRGFERESIHALRSFFKQLFIEENNKSFSEKIAKLAANYDQDIVKEVIAFINSQTSNRSFLKTKNLTDNLNQDA